MSLVNKVKTAISDVVVNKNVLPSAELQEPVTLTLDERGMIRDCCNSCEALFGYSRRELVWQHISKLLPQLSGIKLVKDGQINPRLGFVCRCGHLFRAQSRDDGFFYSELSFVNLEHAGMRILRVFVRPYGYAEA